MDFIALATVGFGGALLVQLITFAYASVSRRIDSVDVAWGLSFIAIALSMHLYQFTASPWVLLVDALVVVWGLRLSWHIYRRFKHSPKQDERYTQLLDEWPKKYRSLQLFVKIFLLQAILATVISLPVIVVHHYQPSSGLIAIIGIIVWLVGFICESVADKQLKNFLAAPEHKDLMTDGLWHYSRHPNYFGEVSMWWGIALISASTPVWWLGFIGAITITVLICFVSGIPLAEKRSATKNGWRVYKNTTSVLFPWPPKK